MANTTSGALGYHWYAQSMVLAGPESPGDEFCVDSNTGASTNSGLDWNNALATIDQGVNKCAASHGDTVWVHPSHAETIIADSAIDIDGAGIRVRGIRHGRCMPTISVATSAAADCKLAAAGVSIENLRFTGDVDEISGCIEVSGADCSVLNCEFRDVTGQATDVIMVLATGDRCLIDGWTHFGSAVAGTNASIALDGCDDAVIRNFRIYGDFAVGAIDMRTTAVVRCRIYDGYIWTVNSADVCIVDTKTASTGSIGPNIYMRVQDDGDNITETITAATCQVFGPNYVVNAVAEQTMLLDWTTATHA